MYSILQSPRFPTICDDEYLPVTVLLLLAALLAGGRAVLVALTLLLAAHGVEVSLKTLLAETELGGSTDKIHVRL